MTTLKYRRLDSNHDYTFGGGKSDFLIGIDAFAQAIDTKLRLYFGEWWEDINDGLPMWQKILTYGAKREIIDRIIQARIMKVPTALSTESVISSLENRAYSFRCAVNSSLGKVVVTNSGRL